MDDIAPRIGLMIILIRLAIAVFIGWWLFKLARRVLAGAAKSFSGFDKGRSAEVADMVQDPVCGSYISLNHALALKRDGKTIYFCSEKCQNKFINS